MTYQYEALNPERFQQLAQALIVSYHPNTQCLPVGQPDGGRDAFVLNHEKDGPQDITVFQVKFVRSGEAQDSDAIQNWLRMEGPKVERLKEWGATRYILVTNLKGSAHLDIGSIDKINKLLSTELDIEAQCWWRSDLDARLDGKSSVKWSYPEIMKGTDVIEVLVKAFSTPNRRLRDAFYKYITSQYLSDGQVKFKQVDLQNGLFNLFVDTPCFPRGRINGVLINYKLDDRYMHPESMHHRHSLERTAEFLLGRKEGPLNANYIVQGAPGQGKSTITQFVCQIHRARLLNKMQDLDNIEARYLETPVKLPFRVNLRDFSTWLSGISPYSQSAHGSPTSLEALLAHQIHNESGGVEFSVGDLNAVLEGSEVIIALDGFDEIADVDMRARIVSEVSKSSRRMKVSGTRAQFIVTSRPTALKNADTFSESEWLYLNLTALERSDIDKYSARWMKARGLDTKETKSLKEGLRAKLAQPHMMQLAGNPMQLTILLSLMHTSGPSLPDKRTALYDRYVERFLSREAEKSDIVKEHQELLVNIHQYIAWRMQCRAERDPTKSDAFGEEEIKELLINYLSNEGHNISLVERLFTGMVDRVFMLVSRVQGTYEFEVQSLKEYFCAKFLYQTARYSPPGTEKSGTKPERLEAIVCKPYWQNTTRFFCGCYSRGELFDLIASLEAVRSQEYFIRSSYIGLIALQLLSDHVFAQQPHAVKKAVEFVTEHPTFRNVLSYHWGDQYAIGLPERSGRAEILSFVKNAFSVEKQWDTLVALGDFIRENSTKTELLEFWKSLRPDDAGTRSLHSLSKALRVFQMVEYEDIIQSKMETRDIIRCLAYERRLNSIAADDRLLSSFFEIDYGSTIAASFIQAEGNNFFLVAYLRLTSPETFFLSGNYRYSLYKSLQYFDVLSDTAKDFGQRLKGNASAEAAIEIVSLFLKYARSQTEVDLVKFSAAAADISESFAPRTTNTLRLSVYAAFRQSRKEIPLEKPERLWQLYTSARVNSNNTLWWDAFLRNELNPNASRALCVCFFASPRIMDKYATRLSRVLDVLDKQEWRYWIKEVERVFDISADKQLSSFGKSLRFFDASPRLLAVLSFRLRSTARAKFLGKYFGEEYDEDAVIVGIIARSLIDVPEDKIEWESALHWVKKAYNLGEIVYIDVDQASKVPRHVVMSILAEPEAFPLSFVALADEIWVGAADKHFPPVAVTSNTERWMDL